MAQITVIYKDYAEMVEVARQILKGEAERAKDATVTQVVKDTVEAAGAQEKTVTATEQEEKSAKQNDEEYQEVTYTLVDVRAKLAELQKSGKREQVKKLLAELGAGKLSEVPEEKYALLMEKAGEL